MHLQLVVSNDSPKTLPQATAGTPSESLNVAEKREIRDTVLALEVLPGVTVAEALAEYTERGKLIDFAASEEGNAADDDEVLKSELRVAQLCAEAGLRGLLLHRNATPEGGTRRVEAIVFHPGRLVKAARSLRRYKDKLYMLSLR